MKRPNRAEQKGVAILEFALVAPLLVLIFVGTVGVGIVLGRSIHAVQFCRDVAHMYVDGVDFSQAGNQALAVQLAQVASMTPSSGDAVVIFSRISTVYQADCDGAGVACNNLGLPVITQRIVVGNAALRSSDFGTPAPGILDSRGNISPNVYLTNSNSTVQASNFAPLLAAAGMTQQQGDVTWIAESYFAYTSVMFFAGSPGVYTRFLF